ncbi:MAG TPA: glutathione S-transferase N-terminal domain-containing protein [Acetobacteraceae bacterium]|jgi:glutathione S-transferase|nr:glutathione S-transferase N-terminal domain-containing protein [Acetobacteraceae bacterium]
MLALYYFPGPCSLAAHVALEETGAAYERRTIELRSGEQNREDYRRINSRAQVPALDVDGTVITESVAILTFIGGRFPEARLLPIDLIEQARCQAFLAWISSQVDPVFRRLARPERIVPDEVARLAVKLAATHAYWAKCREIDALLGNDLWVMGTHYTVCDPYALVYYGWVARIGLPVADLTRYTALEQRLLDRPAVRRVLELEKHPLLATT